MMTNDRREKIKDQLKSDFADSEYWEEKLKEIEYIRMEILRTAAEIDPT